MAIDAAAIRHTPAATHTHTQYTADGHGSHLLLLLLLVKMMLKTMMMMVMVMPLAGGGRATPLFSCSAEHHMRCRQPQLEVAAGSTLQQLLGDSLTVHDWMAARTVHGYRPLHVRVYTHTHTHTHTHMGSWAHRARL